MLDYQARLGAPWAVLLGWPIYEPWRLFDWWYHYEAYAPQVFNKAAMLAGASGFMGCAAAIVGSLWRARQSRLVTTYGSSRWATADEIRKTGLCRPAGVFLGRLKDDYTTSAISTRGWMHIRECRRRMFCRRSVKSNPTSSALNVAKPC